MTLDLKELGWDDDWSASFEPYRNDGLAPGRVAVQHRGGYVVLAERGEAGEVYNVCSGEGVAVGELAVAVLQRVGVRADITTDPSLVRPVDLPALVGSPEKLRRATGWSPRRTRADIIDDLIHAQTR